MTPRPGAFEVLYFWFGARPYTALQVQQHTRLWFGESGSPELTPQTDELVRERFGDLTQQAADGKLGSWESGPRRRLALILLLDQFPRNIFRGSVRAFAYDEKALALALSGMQSAADAALSVVERIFFYMPLQHAESREVQDESVAAYRRLRQEAPEELQAVFDAALRSAENHRAIVEEFGRFPHRNELLERTSTAAEVEWLRKGGATFAQ